MINTEPPNFRWDYTYAKKRKLEAEPTNNEIYSLSALRVFSHLEGADKSNLKPFVYLENKPDIPESVRNTEIKLVVAKVRKVSDETFGVFAIDDIQKGEFLGEYLGEITDQKSQDTVYSFLLSDNKTVISGLEKGNWTRFMNHSNTNSNVLMQEQRNRIFFWSNAPIKKGEQLLINYGARYFENKDFKPIELLPEDGYKTAAQILQENRSFYISQTEYYCITSVIQAIGQKNLKALKELPDEAFTLPALPLKEMNPLDRKTPLHMAVLSGDINITAYLLEKDKVSKHQVTTMNQNALHLAFFNKDPFPMVQLLLNHGLIADTQRTDGKAPIHLSIERNDINSFELLLQKAPLKSDQLQVALQIAIKNERMVILDTLATERRVPVKLIQDNNFLHKVCQLEDKKLSNSLIKKLLQKLQVDDLKKLCQKDEQGNTPLFLLDKNHNRDGFEFLLSQYDDRSLLNELALYKENEAYQKHLKRLYQDIQSP